MKNYHYMIMIPLFYWAVVLLYDVVVVHNCNAKGLHKTTLTGKTIKCEVLDAK